MRWNCDVPGGMPREMCRSHLVTARGRGRGWGRGRGRGRGAYIFSAFSPNSFGSSRIEIA